jgi:hypothetical protein
VRSLVLLLVGLVGCSGRAGPPPAHGPMAPQAVPGLQAAAATRLPPCPPAATPPGAALTGVLRTPSGAFPISGASVSLLQPNGAPAATATTDGCGRFALPSVAPGPYTVRYGLRSFGGMAPVSLLQQPARALNTPLGIPLPFPFPGAAGAAVPPIFNPALDAGGLRAGVVRGSWDHIEALLDKMGIPYVLYEADALEEDAPYQHRMLFVACGAAAIPDKADKKIKKYVEGGGALYASDLSIAYVGEVFEKAVNYDYESRGDSGARKAYVVDPELAVALKGASQIDLTYDMSGWQRLAVNQPPGTQAMLRDVETNEPSAVTFNRGAGVVKYTTFHVEAQVSEAEEAALVYMISRM